MRLDLDGLSLRGGQRHECAYSVNVTPVSLGGAKYEVVLPDGVTVAVDRVAGGFLVSIALDAKVYGPCTRCLSEVELDVHADEQEFAPTTTETWAESEMSAFITDLIVDVSGLTREALVLALPNQVLCSPGCRGLCPQCGQDLNRGLCGCSP
jgi:uncharacterized protein